MRPKRLDLKMMRLRDLPQTYKLPLARRIPPRGAYQVSTFLLLIGFGLLLSVALPAVAQENPSAEATPPVTSCVAFTKPKDVEERKALRDCVRKMQDDRKVQRNQERLQRIYDGSVILTEHVNRFLGKAGATAPSGGSASNETAPPAGNAPPNSSP